MMHSGAAMSAPETKTQIHRQANMFHNDCPIAQDDCIAQMEQHSKQFPNKIPQ
jgi:hypothetical protein